MIRPGPRLHLVHERRCERAEGKMERALVHARPDQAGELSRGRDRAQGGEKDDRKGTDSPRQDADGQQGRVVGPVEVLQSQGHGSGRTMVLEEVQKRLRPPVLERAGLRQIAGPHRVQEPPAGRCGRGEDLRSFGRS